MNQIIKYTCPKCGSKQYEIGELWTVGSFWTRMFQIHNRRFTFISCQKCRYTELYKVPQKNIGEVINTPAR
jgi:predicted nucleic-acid-binding Zn-ribbon protein